MFPQLKMPADPGIYKSRILNFTASFPDAVFLDSNSGSGAAIPFTGITYDYIAAAGIVNSITANENELEALQVFLNEQSQKGNWVFGYLSYDLKNNLEKLTSSNPDHAGFADFHFFSAQHVFIAKGNEITVIDKTNPELLWKKITESDFVLRTEFPPQTNISHMLSREEYLEAVDRIMKHIHHGDIYEINFCHQILAHVKNFDPVGIYGKLTAISPNPFSCYVRTGNRHLLCTSPERFLRKNKEQLISQPIKGSAARGNNPENDEKYRRMLAASEKERSENVMIVDLVRNDLAKVATKNSVHVEELCGLYTYTKIHQLISTVSCKVKEQVNFTDIIRALFPMGSMTGAPKISAMKIIEQLEKFKRSLFSGSVGYFTPEGDFDFNVVIRSVSYHEQNEQIAIAAGSAITAASDPAQEYHETLVKLMPQLEALGISMESFLKATSDGNVV